MTRAKLSIKTTATRTLSALVVAHAARFANPCPSAVLKQKANQPPLFSILFRHPAWKTSSATSEGKENGHLARSIGLSALIVYGVGDMIGGGDLWNGLA
jgi:hypothetical protein